METLQAILTRRSIRRYTPHPIAEDQIETIIRAGMYAPSAVNKQPWHFIVFRNVSTIEKIVEVHPNASMLQHAAAGILVCWDDELQHDTGYGPVDCSAATQNMLLAAHSLGIGAVWVGIYPRPQRIEVVHKVFRLPIHIKPFSILSLGYPAEEKPQPDRFMPARIHNETW